MTTGADIGRLLRWMTAFRMRALDGLEEFSHLEILFHFHKADPAKEITGKRHPRNNPAWPAVGIFARRGKNRPNHLGLTVVKLMIRREGRTLEVENLDALDGTPVIDIKADDVRIHSARAYIRAGMGERDHEPVLASRRFLAQLGLGKSLPTSYIICDNTFLSPPPAPTSS